MVGISAKEAAEQVGLTKQAILKSVKSGKISAQKDVNGEWQIEPVELFRVYEPVAANANLNGNGHQATATFASNGYEPAPTVTEEPRTFELLREMLRDKDEVIMDLRQRLDVATEENQRLTAVLTTQLSPPKAKKGWWQRLLGG